MDGDTRQGLFNGGERTVDCYLFLPKYHERLVVRELKTKGYVTMYQIRSDTGDRCAGTGPWTKHSSESPELGAASPRGRNGSWTRHLGCMFSFGTLCSALPDNQRISESLDPTPPVSSKGRSLNVTTHDYTCHYPIRKTC